MEQILEKNQINQSISIFNTLLSSIILILLIQYFLYHWNRRRLYKYVSLIPGPRTLPFIGNGLSVVRAKNGALEYLMYISDKYDSPVRLWMGSSVMIFVQKPNEMEIIMNSPHALEKEDIYKLMEPLFGHGLVTAPVHIWKKHRKIIMPTFNQKILNGFVEIFSRKTNNLVYHLRKESGKGPFDIYRYVLACTFDIICRTAMGIEIEAQEKESEFAMWMDKLGEIACNRMFSIFFHTDFIFYLTPSGRLQKKLCEKLLNYTTELIKKKRECYYENIKEMEAESKCLNSEEIKQTFLERLIELTEDSVKFTTQELCDEVCTFMAAGSETTATSNCFTSVLLGMNPEIQQKVYEEIISVLGPDRNVEYTDLIHLKYLDMVIKESLRIFPIAPIFFRKLDEDIKLDNFILPRGSSVGLNIMKLHRDPKIWPDPLKFDPDRFLPSEVAKRHPYSYLPFSGGPRNCAGMKYANAAMKTFLATLLRKYKFSTGYESVEEIELRSDITLKPVNGYKISLELRE